jgi:hypothetical protein
MVGLDELPEVLRGPTPPTGLIRTLVTPA